jgi:uncharacterized protein (TIGR02145 family)
MKKISILIIAAFTITFIACGPGAKEKKEKAEKAKQDSVARTDSLERAKDTILVKDIDGNVYHTVTIGKQICMSEDLKVTRYRDGTAIPNVSDNKAWSELTSGAYCVLYNQEDKKTVSRKLYNWYTVSSIHNIAPPGWHVPSDSEWTTLTNYITQHETDAEEESTLKVFSIDGTGRRDDKGSFWGDLDNDCWWSSTSCDKSNAWSWMMNERFTHVDKYSTNKRHGNSVRLIRDK